MRNMFFRIWVLTLALACGLAACDDDATTDTVFVVLAADPPSLYQGERQTVQLVAAEPCFFEDGDDALESDGDLVIESLERLDDTTAVAVVSAEEANVEIGLHRFELELADCTARLDFSVLAPPVEPGTIRLEGNLATAGATMATLHVWGDGTQFDPGTSVTFKGVDGANVVFTQVKTPRWIEVRYNIALDQPAVAGEIIVDDGRFVYREPFDVISAQSFENQATGQALIKGRPGRVRLTHPDAGLTAGTHFVLSDGSVAVNTTNFISETEVEIPVHLPFDYQATSLELTAHTFTEGGAVLELMTATVELIEPGYAAVTPSVVPATAGPVVLAAILAGYAFADGADDLVFTDTAFVALTDWSVPGAAQLDATVDLASGVSGGAHLLTIQKNNQQLPALFAVEGSGVEIHLSEPTLRQDEDLYCVIVVAGYSLTQDAELFSITGIDVSEQTLIDDHSLAVRLSVADDALTGSRRMSLYTGTTTFPVDLDVVHHWH